MGDTDLMFAQLALGNPQFQAFLRDTYLLMWTMSNAYHVLSATLNASNVITSATVQWPNGIQGVYTLLQENGIYPVADSFSITYVTPTGLTRTVTQPAGITRNAAGAITSAPPLTVT
ncbi:hypothetical protein [Paraburkholderia sp. C35]|uniref:hypothetical protein n=1 Tax=Paraburkholderia sp. C35 TaxID=2126993 RepID=UPI000D68AA36|nr:hypothetical protein [Paraburkholderia sp. C35]